MGGAKTARNVTFACFVCRRVSKQSVSQKMADLPESRCEVRPPFEAVGVDCFGPVDIKEGRRTVKRWAVLFTCLSSRATHIEVLHSMDTSSMMSAMRRMVARRGHVMEVVSDNGTNFTGVARELQQELKDMVESEMKDVLMKEKISWTFIPPHSPHAGGIWERQIRTIKEVLAKMLWEFGMRLDDEILHTLLCEVELVMNSRPLTRLSADPTDPPPITANQILTMRTDLARAPPGAFGDVDLYSRKRWRRVQYLADIFWSRWKREYLAKLQVRQKWTRETRIFKVGDIVAIKESELARGEWLIGRVVDVREARDGFPRAARLRIAGRRRLERGLQDLVFITEA